MPVDQDIKYAVTAEDRFTRTFANLKRDITGSAGQFSQLTNAAGIAGRVLATVTLGGAVGAGGFAIAVRQLANDLDSLNDASDALGDSVENISALEDVARRNGGNLELVVTSVNKLNKALGEAKADSPVALALQRIGLQASELRQLDPSEALRRVAVALQGYATDGNKARLVQELFGKSLKEVAPFLKDLAEAGALNARVTSAQAAEAEKFNKQLFALSTNASNAGRAFLTNSGTLRALNEDLVRLNALGDVFGGVLKGAAALTLEGKRFTDAGTGAAFYASKIRDIQALRDQAAADPRPLVRAFGPGQYDEQIKQLQQFETFYRKVFALTAPDNGQSDPTELARRGRGPATLQSVGDMTGAGDKAKVTGAERYLETLQKQVEKAQDLKVEQQLLRDIERGRIDGMTPALEKQLVLEARRLDSLNAQEKALRAQQQALDDLIATSLKRADEVDSLLAATPTGRLKELERQADLITKLSRANPNDVGLQRQALEAITDLNKRAQELISPASAADAEFKKLEVTVTDFASNSIDAIAEFAATGKGSFSNLFDIFKADVLKALIEDPVRDSMRNVVKTIRDELGQLNGQNNPLAGLFSYLGGLFGSAGGTSSSINYAGQFDGFRAGGGRVRRGRAVVVGEKRPELFVPDQDGTVLPSTDVAGAGGVMQNNYYTINGGTDAWRRELRAALDERDARLVRSMRYGRLAGA